MATSSDGLIWTKQGAVKGIENGWVAITFNDGLFVGISDDGLAQRIAISRNGIVWALGDTGTGQALGKIAYRNGTYVALTSDGTTLQAGRVTEVRITTESLFAADTNRVGVARVTRTGGTESDLLFDLSDEGTAVDGQTMR